MNNKNNITNLYKTLSEIVKTGDENAARSFLIDHLNEFPEEVQKKIIFEFFNDSLDNSVEIDTGKIQIQKTGMDLIEEIQKTEKSLEEQKKVIDIQLDLM